MKTINYLIVELEDVYENKVTLESGQEVIVNSTIEEVNFIKRKAKVISAPDFTILKNGDEVIVHHNIFRLRNDVRGNVAQSNYYIGENTYIVPLNEVFMYKRDDSDWIALNPFSFIEPIEKVKEEGFQLSFEEDSYKGRVDRVGIAKYLSPDLIEQGVQVGDKVVYKQYSEYEFVVDGKLYYKMRNVNILGIV